MRSGHRESQRASWRELWPVLTGDQISRITPYGTWRDLAAGDVVFSAGSPTAELFVVESGIVDVFRDPIRDLPAEPVVTRPHFRDLRRDRRR